MYSRDYTKLYANVKKLREGVKAFLNNKGCENMINKNAIELRNIDLNGLTLMDELNKANEEVKEFKDAVHEYLYLKNDNWSKKAINESREHIKEEFCDVVQSHLSVLKMLGIDIKEISEYWNKVHNEKIKNRPRVKED